MAVKDISHAQVLSVIVNDDIEDFELFDLVMYRAEYKPHSFTGRLMELTGLSAKECEQAAIRTTEKFVYTSSETGRTGRGWEITKEGLALLSPEDRQLYEDRWYAWVAMVLAANEEDS